MTTGTEKSSQLTTKAPSTGTFSTEKKRGKGAEPRTHVHKLTAAPCRVEKLHKIFKRRFVKYVEEITENYLNIIMSVTQDFVREERYHTESLFFY
jgi:hypothetical protein